MSSFEAALTQMETRYPVALKSTQRRELDPDQVLTETITWVQKKAGDAPELKYRAELLVQRLKRIRDEVGDISAGETTATAEEVNRAFSRCSYGARSELPPPLRAATNPRSSGALQGKRC